MGNSFELINTSKMYNLSHKGRIDTLEVSASVDPVNCSRPYSSGALILQAIMPLRELGSGHSRLSEKLTSGGCVVSSLPTL